MLLSVVGTGATEKSIGETSRGDTWVDNVRRAWSAYGETCLFHSCGATLDKEGRQSMPESGLESELECKIALGRGVGLRMQLEPIAVRGETSVVVDARLEPGRPSRASRGVEVGGSSSAW